MKKYIVTLLLAIDLLGASASFAQDGPKEIKKERKAMKKEDKMVKKHYQGAERKTIKKKEKAQKKEDKAALKDQQMKQP